MKNQESSDPKELTIGMATYRDFDGVYFTVQALRLYQDLGDTELLVIDNYGCEDTRKFVGDVPGARYIRLEGVTGTALPRDRVFREATGEAVLCVDCHILLVPGAIARLRRYYREHPDCLDRVSVEHRAVRVCEIGDGTHVVAKPVLVRDPGD